MRSGIKLCQVVGLIFLFLLTSCNKATPENPVNPVNPMVKYESYKDIPNVTDEEIEQIEALKRGGKSYVFGSLRGTETFVNGQGEIEGFTRLMCDWFSSLFGIPFDIELYEWDELISGLDSGDVDFTGELTATDERRSVYHMTDAIVERSIKYIRLDGSEKLSDISSERKLRFAFLEGVTTADAVRNELGNTYDVRYVDNYDEAYNLLKSGEIDAFIEESPVEGVFDEYPDVHSEDLLPQIFSPVSFSTRLDENKVIISVVQKILEAGGSSYLTDLYLLGEAEYAQHKFFCRLTDDELDYLRENRVIQYVAASDNYPLSFYNGHTQEFQGISCDILSEVEALTGVQFEVVSAKTDTQSNVTDALDTGKVQLAATLVHTDERDGKYLWASTPILSDRHALLSKSELKNISMNEVLRMRVGVVKGYSYTEVFLNWFPKHDGIKIYTDFPEAFDALENDEIDLLMGSHSLLLMQANYRERPGYKANIIFQQPFEYTMGFSLDASTLCSIIDKALQVIDVEHISTDWTGRTYDYSSAMTRLRVMGLGGVLFLCICIIVILILVYRSASKTAYRLITFQNVIIEEAAQLVEYRDGDTGGHIGRTSTYLRVILNELRNSSLYKDQTEKWDIEKLVLSAQLHDVGKVAIGDSILCKPGKLTQDEYEVMKQHTVVGGEIIESLQRKVEGLDFLDDAKVFALYHHERWDGKGYPYGLAGEDIPLLARIMAVIDVYDALVSERPYKRPFSKSEAKKIIVDGRGTQFDPHIVDVFIQNVVDKLVIDNVDKKGGAALA